MTHAIFPLIATLALVPQITVETEYPTVGKATTVHLSEYADTVVVTYRPDAPAVKVVEEVSAGGTNDIVWRPLHPGVVRIEAGGASKEISVKFDGVPMSGVLIMLIAGAVLVGGAAYSTYQLMRE